MDMTGIKEILNNSKIIKITETLYFCVCKNWTVKIQLSENTQNYLLHYNASTL